MHNTDKTKIDLAVDALLPPDVNIGHHALEHGKLVVMVFINKDHRDIKNKRSFTAYFVQKHLLVSSQV
ncbi:MAG: hypothetical protein JKX78_15515 [Alteromonadaceae bacterium]|nr:hypothetical protein [Alteromonadaceae bacterium]